MFGLLLARGLHNLVNLLSLNTQVVWSHAQLQPLIVRGGAALRREGVLVPFEFWICRIPPSAESWAEKGQMVCGRGSPAR